MTPLLYALHSGNLYGTERMALATLEGLRAEFAPRLFAPRGPVLAEAEQRGIPVEAFDGAADFARRLQPHVARARRFAFVATGVVHSAAGLALQALYLRRVAHLHLVHGGTDERLSYGRKRVLNGLPVRFVAVSDFVRSRLVANGVRAGQIAVVENFLPRRQLESVPRRAPFGATGIRRVAMVSRLDPIKRVELLLDALDLDPALRALEVTVFGTGWGLETLRERARRDHPNVRFAGFVNDVAQPLARHDLLLHTCAEEPFGLAVIEAMAARLPVLVPDSGGAGALVEDNLSGFRFRANDARDLAARLRGLTAVPAHTLNAVTAAACAALATRFDEQARLAQYRHLLEGAL